MSNDRILLRSNLVNVTDYQAEHTWPEGQNLIKDVYQVMSYLNGMYNGSSKAVQLASDGSQLVTLQTSTNKQQVRLFDSTSTEYSFSNPFPTRPASTITNVALNNIALTASGQIAALGTPIRNSVLVGVSVSAVSGTTPTADFYLQYNDSLGNWYDIYHFPQFTTVGNAACTIGAGGIAAIPPISSRVRYVIAGTTPSFTTNITVAGL